MKQYVIALDQGTTSSRAIIFDRQLRIVAQAQTEFPQLFPQPGWVEHDPMELYSSQYGAMMEAYSRANISAAEIAAIGITNQRETTLLWDRETGEPIANAIVWQCRRTADQCLRIQSDAALSSYIREVTGLPVDAYFSATKIQWLLEHVPGARERAEAGRLCFGTVDSWLIWKLTGGAVHVTDDTNASRTMLYNIHTRAVGRPAVRDLWDSHVHPARGAVLRLRLWPRNPRRRAHPHRRCRRRPAGGSLRSGLPPPRAGQKYIRHRLFPFDAHRAYSGREPSRPDYHAGRHAAGRDWLRAGGQRLHRRFGHPMAAGRDAPDPSEPPTPRRWPGRSPTPAASILCPPSRGWARPTGTCTPGAPSWG